MKKAIQANINGNIFYIDEDAYNLLQGYLDDLSATFQGPDGQEIVQDIEMRVGELFAEYIAQGHNVVDIDYVGQVIDIVGRPEDLGSQVGSDSEAREAYAPKAHKKIYRDVNNKMLGGVISGLAEYLGWDTNIMRVLYALLVCCTQVLPGVLIYLVAWMVIPPANTPRRRLEMMGEEVTVDAIGRNAKEPYPEPQKKSALASGIGSAIEICCKIFFGIIALAAGAVVFGMSIAVISMLFFLISFLVVGVPEMVVNLGLPNVPGIEMQCWWALVGAMILLLLGIIIVWAIGSALFNWKSISRNAGIGMAITLAVLFAAFFILLGTLIANNIHPFPFVM